VALSVDQYVAFGVLFVIAAAVFAVLRWGKDDSPAIAFAQLPDVVRQLATTGKDGSFACFLLGQRDEDPRQDVWLQFSIEENRLGLDWELDQPGNIAEKDRIIAFAEARGHAINERQKRKWRYLRVEDATVIELGVQIATELYHVDRGDRIQTFLYEFVWPPANAS